ncbi:NAD(P)H-binding protein [Candidatus Saccharibacteria bacterium]|nr:NAD(P)H-binding protein [Candidatus Saccharibacteria bacterium]
MRIAVIAADGRSGQFFVEAALAAGYTVRAGIYGKNRFSSHPRLTVLQCDATNETHVAKLLHQTDAVVSLIGHVPGSERDVQTIATRTVLKVMSQRGIRRIVSLTGTGVRVPGDKPGVVDKLANLFIAKVDPNRVRDGITHAEVLKASDIDFTIVRVLKLGNGEGGRYQLTDHGPAKYLTARREVAAAILECLEDNRYIRGYPVIST